MKIILVFTVLAVAANALSIQEQWTEFKDTYARQYKNLREEKFRFKIFQNNVHTIEEHNAKYNNGEVSFYMAVNQFADMSSEEFMAMMNSQISTRPNIITTPFVKDPALSVPDSIDWRDKGAVLDVKNQGRCGSCWAFSAVAALEGQLAITKHKKQKLSEQQLVDCDKKSFGCRGGVIDYAFKYVQEQGICSEDSYPYTGKNGECKSCTPVMSTIKGYKKVTATEAALKEAVGTVGPISVGVYSNEHWEFYQSGIFRYDCSGAINHGVTVIGYGTENNTDYWIIRNSWGSKWGDKGYIKLLRGKGLCDVQSHASYPEL